MLIIIIAFLIGGVSLGYATYSSYLSRTQKYLKSIVDDKELMYINKKYLDKLKEELFHEGMLKQISRSSTKDKKKKK